MTYGNLDSDLWDKIGTANQRSKGNHNNATDLTWVIVSLDSVESGKHILFVFSRRGDFTTIVS